MKKKLNCILLIDDDEATNFINKAVIRHLDCAETVVAVESADEALDFLKEKIEDSYQHPDLILLDINMPSMNGWEFLEEYKKLNHLQQAKFVIIMLTASLNPDDKSKADSIEVLDGFERKPLRAENLQGILDKFFLEN